MNTPQGQFDLIPCDRLFARITENLSSYANNGLLDTGRFYPEIRWIIANLGISVYEQEEAILHLEEGQVELPCNFYLLDSAWLCDASREMADTGDDKNFQAKSISYVETTCETVSTGGGCKPTAPPNGVTISSCNSETVLNKVTVKEYVFGDQPRLWNLSNFVLLRLNNTKNIRTICTKNCRNLFASSPEEISILKQGASYYLFSPLKKATIYLRYWKYPVDEKTKLPLIPDDPIIEKAIEAHLMHWFFVQGWTNNDITDVDKKIQYWQMEKDKYALQATSYASFPSFNKMIQITRRIRRRWSSYEIQNTHW